MREIKQLYMSRIRNKLKDKTKVISSCLRLKLETDNFQRLQN